MLPLVEDATWPPLPYKGLSYYGPNDVPLFAGREDDVGQCGKLLGLSSTRILILHGATGCGKSSFLRAGLIPFVEQGGFQFQRDLEGRGGKAIFVRSTDNPLGKLAESVYDFCSRTYQIDTHFGLETLDLSQMLSAYADRTDFLEKAGTSAEEIVQVLNHIASSWPRTLVLVIDQAEEVLTVNVGEEGERYRKQLFEFMSIFSKKKFDLKLLVALRTEFYGRFFDRVRQVAADTVNIRDYLLTELSEEQIIAAIERPTLKTDIREFGKPYDHYKFEYEPGVAKAIAKDLKVTALAGGELPVMQIVCDNLYRTTKLKAEVRGETEWVIQDIDYRDLGGIEGQMDDHLRRVLEDLCKANKIQDLKAFTEMDCWKEVLSKLVKTQVDGTVTTELGSAADLKKIAEETGCKIPFDEGALYLSDDERRILRQVDVIDQRTKAPIHCYSLGHDVIGLVLRRWRLSRETPNLKLARDAEERLRFWTERGKRIFAPGADGNQRSLGSTFRSKLSQPIPIIESLSLWRFADRDRRRILKRNILVFCSRVFAAVLIALLLFTAASFAYTKWTRRESNQIPEVMKNAPWKYAAKDSGGREAISHWVQALVSAGELEKATEVLSALKADDPAWTNAVAALGNDKYLNTDVYADVANALYQSHRKESDDLWNRAIGLAARDNPDDKSHRFADALLQRLVPALLKIGEYQKAIDVVHKIKDPFSRVNGLLAVAAERCQKGQAAEAEKQWNEALDTIKKEPEFATPRSIYPLVYVASAMAEAGRFDLALGLVHQIEKLGGGDGTENSFYLSGVWDSLARSFAKAGRFSEAIEDANRIRDPGRKVDVLAYVALKQSKAGKTEDANKTWADAIKTAGDYLQSLQKSSNQNDREEFGYSRIQFGQFAFANIARRYAQAGNAEEARKNLEQALKDVRFTSVRSPGSDPRLDALYAVVAALVKSGNYDKARDLATRNEDPTIRGRALSELNSALTRAGKTNVARDIALGEEGPVKIKALSAIAQVLTDMKNADEAKKVWDLASEAAGQLGNVTERSTAFASIGKGLACLHLYYEARAAGDRCGDIDKLEVYAAILAEHERTKHSPQKSSMTDCFGDIQPPWKTKKDDE